MYIERLGKNKVIIPIGDNLHKKISVIIFILFIIVLATAPIHAHDSNDTTIVKDSTVKTYTELNNKIQNRVRLGPF